MIINFFPSQIQVASIEGYVSKCVKSGVKCSDCENLMHCVTTPRGMISHKLNYCNNTNYEYCSAKDGGCSPDPASCKIFGLKELPCQVSFTLLNNIYHQLGPVHLI